MQVGRRMSFSVLAFTIYNHSNDIKARDRNKHWQLMCSRLSRNESCWSCYTWKHAHLFNLCRHEDWISLSSVSTTRVNGPSWRVTGFHYPSTRSVLTGARFHQPSTRPVNSGSGNRALMKDLDRSYCNTAQCYNRKLAQAACMLRKTTTETDFFNPSQSKIRAVTKVNHAFLGLTTTLPNSFVESCR